MLAWVYAKLVLSERSPPVKLNIAGLAAVLQTLLTTDATHLAKATRLVQRERKLTGAGWVQTLVLGWGQQPDATLEDLVDHAANLGFDLSVAALDRWFCFEGARCLEHLVQRAVALVVQSQPAAVPLLQQFVGVYVDDCTAVALPADLADRYPGCGGSDPAGGGTATLKLFVRLDLRAGPVTTVALQGGRHQDVVAGQQAPRLPAGALRLKDLGFFDTQEFARDTAAGVHWISRVPCHVVVQVGSATAQPITAWLEKQTDDQVDVSATIGTQHPLECRLIAVRCSEEVRERRLRKLAEHARRKGSAVSPRQRIMCGWTVLLTNLPAARLQVAEAWVLYRARWQIELLFKLWKSHGRLDRSRGHRGERVLCEVLAKLLALVVQHWLVLTTCPWFDGVALRRKFRVVRECWGRLLETLDQTYQWERVLARLRRRLERLRPRRRRQKTPLTLELLNNPALAKFGLS